MICFSFCCQNCTLSQSSYLFLKGCMLLAWLVLCSGGWRSTAVFQLASNLSFTLLPQLHSQCDVTQSLTRLFQEGGGYFSYQALTQWRRSSHIHKRFGKWDSNALTWIETFCVFSCGLWFTIKAWFNLRAKWFVLNSEQHAWLFVFTCWGNEVSSAVWN